MGNDLWNWDSFERGLILAVVAILLLMFWGCATTPQPRIIDMRPKASANSQDSRSKPVTPQGHVIDFRR